MSNSQKSEIYTEDMLYQSIYNNIMDSNPSENLFFEEVIEYRPEYLVGILIHEYLGDPRAKRNVTYSSNIYIDRAKRGLFNRESLDMKTVLRQDVIVELIDAAPQNLNIYSELNTMFVAFETSFQKYNNACKEYKELIENLKDEYKDIRNSEVRIIKNRRIKRYRHSLSNLFSLIEDHYPEIYVSLYENFSTYDIDIGKL